jgi:hypothetical protein
MRRNYNEWMMEEIKELTPTGKLKRPSYETVANWVKDSWNAVDVNLIRRSFKCCGVSNNRDGSEDDWIFNYDRLGQTDRLNDGVEIPSDKEDEEVQESEKDEEYENSERDEESSDNGDDSERDEESSNNDDDSERDEESSDDDSERNEESSDDVSERDEESSEEEGEYHKKENDEEEDECEEEEDKCNENEGESEDDEFCGYYKQETNYVNVWDE